MKQGIISQYRNYERYKRRVKVYRSMIDQANRVFNQRLEEYRIGTGTITAVIDAHKDLVDKKTTYINNLYNGLKAYFDLIKIISKEQIKAVDMHIIFFEDSKTINFFPLAFSHSVADFLIGTSSLTEEAERSFSSTISISAYTLKNPDYESIVQEIEESDATGFAFLNSRLRSFKTLKQIVKLHTFYTSEDDLVGFLTDKKEAKQILKRMKTSGGIFQYEEGLFPSIDLGSSLLYEYIWEMMVDNKEVLKSSAQDWEGYKAQPSGNLIMHEQIFLKEMVTISPFAVLDASKGPIYIDANASILPFTYLEGPVYIGERTEVLGGRIGKGTSIGHDCRVHGEIENSIIFPFTNKCHDGYIGHSILGSWVNIGAGTTTSDLKNNYSQVKVQA